MRKIQEGKDITITRQIGVAVMVPALAVILVQFAVLLLLLDLPGVTGVLR